jgi:predicted ATPase
MSDVASGGVFISYRRQEASGLAGRLYDRLAARFGDDQVFMDVDTIALGVDFAEVITQAVSTCQVLLAIIGPRWLTASDQDGRRLDDPDDIVRLEIAAALERDIRVIPILVEGAVMPRLQELPENLAGLARRNALILRHESFRADADRLLTAIEPILRPPAAAASVPLGPAPAVTPPTTPTEPEPTEPATTAETTTPASIRPEIGWPSTQIGDNAQSSKAGPRDINPPGFIGSEGGAFIGRVEELATLKRLLSRGSTSRLVTITGEGGIGKTRLAREYALGMSESVTDGIFWVDLGSTFAVQDVATEISRAVGIEGALIGGADDLIQVLRTREILLVLDNFEAVADKAPMISHILAQCPGIKILVTSRERLGLPGEKHLRLPPLSYGPDTADSEATQLFITRALESAGEQHWRPEDLAAVQRICALVEGVPLAVELVASQTEHLGLRDILKMLEESSLSHVLRDRPRLERDQHVTLGDTFESSFKLLNESQARLIEDISYFSGGASLDAIAALSNRTDRPVLVDDIRNLVERSLLRVDASRSHTRYYMLAPLREYARNRLSRSNRSADVAAAHATYFLENGWKVRDVLLGPQQHIVLDDVEADVWNYVDAHRLAIRKGDAGAAMRLVSGLSRLWFVRNHIPTGQLLANRTAQIAQGQKGDVWVEWTITRALLAWLSDDPNLADDLLAAAWDYATKEKRPYFQANAAANRGLVAVSQSRLSQARSYYVAGESLASRHGDLWNLAICRAGLGSVAHAEGKLEEALNLYLDSIQLFRDVGDTWSLSRILRRLVELGVDMGDQELVSSTAREASILGNALKDAHFQAELDWILGRNAQSLGQRIEAVVCYLKSAVTYIRLGRHRLAIRDLDGATAIFLHQGKVQEAGRTRGLVQQLRGSRKRDNYLEATGVQLRGASDRIAFVTGHDAGLRSSPLAELEVLLTGAYAMRENTPP